MNKKLLFSLLVLLLFSSNTQAQQPQQLFNLSFAGATNCTTATANAQLQITNATVSPLVRYGNTLACAAANDAFNSTGWTSGTTMDVNQYIEFSITANANYSLKLTQISFLVMKSNTGPSNARVAHDGGSGAFTASNDFGVTASSNTITWPVTIQSASGGTVKFRLYGWNGSASGTMRFSNISLSGTVTASPLVIDNATGNVGIATTAAPSQKLEVNGNILARGNVITQGRLMVGTIDAASMNTNNYLLGVNGTAIVNKLIVKKSASPWPDYVFGENHKLVSLDSLQTYLQLNHHLPDVQSAEEVEKNDIDVSVTQATLLKKIEELTLYILAQNKQLVEQNKQQQTQQAELAELKNQVNQLKALQRKVEKPKK